MKYKLLMLLTLVLFSFGAVQAADSIAVKLYNVTDGAFIEDGGYIAQETAEGTPIEYELKVYVENDQLLGGMSLGFEFDSPDGVGINWLTQVDGWGPDGQNTGLAVVTVPAESRLDPSLTGSFDMTGLSIDERMDGTLADSILTGGVAFRNGLEAGLLDNILNIHFSLTGIGDGETKTFTIDSAKIGAAGDFQLFDELGMGIPVLFSGGFTLTAGKTPIDADNNGPAVPATYSLSQNYPNPFNPSTVVNYSVARKSNVNITVLNILGQKVATLVNGELDAGEYQAVWEGVDENGNQAASGIYFYRMTTEDFVQTRKMVLMR